mmetsp:Transcript_11962/g.49951  ORF Transcript_11962/g.49951 Transcript_11962/m.49951 type:complete len:103 (+) Transcript_11962:241-549(+)
MEPQRYSESDLLIPPLNFGMVYPGIYRSGHPNNNNHNFMKKMKLKTILVLCIEEVSGNEQFYQDSGIQVLEFGAFVETLVGSFNYFQTCEVKLTADLVSHRN